MTDAADRGLEKLLQSALELVGAVERERIEGGGVPHEDPPPTAAEVAAALEPGVPVRDGSVDIEVSPDGMNVEATFAPPIGGGVPYTLEHVQTLLRTRGVAKGIDWSVITDALEACNERQSPVTGVVIARGQPPRDELPQHTVIDPSLVAPPSLPQNDEAVDHRALSPFHLVKAGQTLGRVIPLEPGVLGENVFGVPVQYRKPKMDSVRLGKNVRVLDGAVVAAADGRFMLADGVASVSEVLDIHGDVDYATGHIDFPGDVIVHGQIKPGFKVKAGGSLVVERVISATDVQVGGDLVAAHGILGRGNGVVRVGGSIRTGFIENCYVEAGKTIFVRVGCLNSAIHTLDRIVGSSRAVLVGGAVNAQQGVKVAHIGSSSGVRTEIRCGTDYRVARKLEGIRDKSMALATKLREIDRRTGGRAEQRTPEIEDTRRRIQAAIRALAGIARLLANALDKSEDAEIEVTGTLYPGSYVEICRIPLVVDRTLHRVRVTLSKKSGRVVAEPIVGRTV